MVMKNEKQKKLSKSPQKTIKMETARLYFGGVRLSPVRGKIAHTV